MEAAAAGRELIGPAPANNNDGRFTTQAFQVEVEQRRATCPAGQSNSQCSRLEEKATGKVAYRFESNTATSAACPLRGLACSHAIPATRFGSGVSSTKVAPFREDGDEL